MDDNLGTNDRPHRACKRRIVLDTMTSYKKRTLRHQDLSNPPKVTQKQISKLIDCLNENKEPYAQHDWRMQPWDSRPYEVLSGYKIADDAAMSLEGTKIIEEDLCTDLEGSTDITPELLNMPTTTKVRIAKMPDALEPGRDIEEHCAWGIDCFTRRGLMDALSFCPELMASATSDDPKGIAIRSKFVEKILLPTLNSLKNEGWDLFRAAKLVAEEAHNSDDCVKFATASRLLQLMQKSEQHFLKSNEISARVNHLPPHARAYFRAHPKGQGIFCSLQEGIAAGTFVGEYLGELYSPWRWFERQDVFKKRNPDCGLPDFYNIQLERPVEDKDGYGVLFVEGANKGNFVSRLCHSCQPNCRMMSVCAENRLTNALFTLRHISKGEELSWDYSCVTESEREYRLATCLCGSGACRGSFLYFANSSSFQQIIGQEHNFLARNAIILRAASEALSDLDRDRLRKYGIKRHALRANATGDDLVPDWLIKWSALILEFMEHEKEVLPAALIARAKRMPELQLKYSEDNNLAAIEAQGVFMNRLQNLMITLDKAKYFLRNQAPNQKYAPIRFLSDEEVLQHLWVGPESVVHEIREIICKYTRRKYNKRLRAGADDQQSVLSKIDRLITCLNPSTTLEARDGLRSIADILLGAGPEHASLYDGLLLRANTQYMFTPNKYSGVVSTPVQVPVPDSKHPQEAAHSTEVQAHVHSVDVGSLNAADLDSHTKDCSSRRRKKSVSKKTYSTSFLWGQLLMWYKQTIYDPATALSAERRGTLSLPLLENCYDDVILEGTYVSKIRRQMIDGIEKKPDSFWPSNPIWRYRNATRVYGTPMMDEALLKSWGKPNPQLVKNLAEILRQAYTPINAEPAQP